MADARKFADTFMRRELWSAAVAFLDEHAQLVESDFELSWTLGWAHFKQQQFAEAHRFLERATQLAPREWRGHWALGLSCRSLGKYDRAEASLREALRIRDTSLVRFFLALVYMEQGRSAEAEQVHLDGIRMKPESTDCWNAYAAFLSDEGRETEAEEAYAKAHRSPGDSGAR
ncbi:MAG: tetratricopeptide repeat protein [Bryobacteraceae bacterium]